LNFFASYHGRDTISRDWSKSLCLKGGWVTFSANFRGKGRPPPTIIGIRKLESLGYRMVKKIVENFNRLSRVHHRYRRQTDRQTTDGTAIAYSERSLKSLNYHCVSQRVAQNAILLFLLVKFNFCRQKSAAMFLCVKTSRDKVVATLFLYLTVHRRIADDVPISYLPKIWASK